MDTQQSAACILPQCHRWQVLVIFDQYCQFYLLLAWILYLFHCWPLLISQFKLFSFYQLIVVVMFVVYSMAVGIVFRILVERILNTSLVPFSLDAVTRMKRLYTLYANLDDHAVKWVTVYIFSFHNWCRGWRMISKIVECDLCCCREPVEIMYSMLIPQWI